MKKPTAHAVGSHALATTVWGLVRGFEEERLDGGGGFCRGVVRRELLDDGFELGALGGGGFGIVEEFGGGGGEGFVALEVRDELGDDFSARDEVGQREELGGEEEGLEDHVEHGAFGLIDDCHGCAMAGDLKGDGAGGHEGEVGPVEHGVGFAGDDVEAVGPAAGGVGEGAEMVGDGLGCGGDDALEIGAVLAEASEGVEEEGEVAGELGGARSREEGEAGVARW